MTIHAKFPSVCRRCNRKIAVGEQVDWERGSGVTCPGATCQLVAAPAPNVGTFAAKPSAEEVPAGRYAIQWPAGDWRLCRVWRGTRGDNPPVFVYAVKGVEKGERLDRISETIALALIKKDPGKAALEFGHRTGSCSKCGKELDVNLSRKLGMGPVCMKNWFGKVERDGMRSAARDELRAAGLNPADKLDDLAAVA